MPEDWEVGPSHTDPTWSHLFETDTSSGDSSGPSKSEPVLPPVDPKETWVEVPSRRELTNEEIWDLQDELWKAGIPARAWRQNSVLNWLFTRKMVIKPEVPERFLRDARRVAEQFVRDLGRK